MIEVSAGLGPVQLGPSSVPSASLVESGAEIYVTPLIDMTQLLTGMEIVPARFGHIPTRGNFQQSAWIIEQVSGTQTVPASYQAGNDAARSNFMSTTTLSNADVTGANVPSLGTNGGVTAVTTQLFVNSPVFLNITTPASGTGGFRLMAKLYFIVVWMSVDGRVA